MSRLPVRPAAVTFDQNPEVEEQPLRELIGQRGWLLHQVYSDRAGGAKERRPGLDALMVDALGGLFDVVVVWRFDRSSAASSNWSWRWRSFAAWESTSCRTRRRRTPQRRYIHRHRGRAGAQRDSGAGRDRDWSTPASAGPSQAVRPDARVSCSDGTVQWNFASRA